MSTEGFFGAVLSFFCDLQIQLNYMSLYFCHFSCICVFCLFCWSPVSRCSHVDQQLQQLADKVPRLTLQRWSMTASLRRESFYKTSKEFQPLWQYSGGNFFVFGHFGQQYWIWLNSTVIAMFFFFNLIFQEYNILYFLINFKIYLNKNFTSKSFNLNESNEICSVRSLVHYHIIDYVSTFFPVNKYQC